MIDHKLGEIQGHFAAHIGERIVCYETAELFLADGTWTSRPDLPIRFFTGSGGLLAISWSPIEDLWLASDLSLPFSFEDSTVRWVVNGLEEINPALGASIQSVMLGGGEMSIGRKEVEIWTRLVIELDNGWLELFDALDEKGYAFHSERPAGVFVLCIPAS
jgi:hypothetical protein